MTDQSIMICVFDFEHGTYISAHRTHEGAVSAFDDFVRRRWESHMGTPATEMPVDRSERILEFTKRGHLRYIDNDDPREVTGGNKTVVESRWAMAWRPLKD